MDTWKASCSQYLSNLVDNLVWCFTGYTKDWIDVGVVAATFVSDPTSKLFKINLAISVSVEFIEKGCQFVIVEHTADRLKGLVELMRPNSAVTFQVEVLEKSFGSLSFVVCAMGSLTDLFKNDSLDLSKSWSRNN